MASQWSLGGAFRLSSLREAVEDITKALRRLEQWVRSPVVLGDAEVKGDVVVGTDPGGDATIRTQGRVGVNINSTYQAAVAAASATDADVLLAGMNGVTNGFTVRRVSSLWQAKLWDGVMEFASLSADPAGAANGSVYYNTTTNKLRVRAAGAWVDLH